MPMRNWRAVAALVGRGVIRETCRDTLRRDPKFRAVGETRRGESWTRRGASLRKLTRIAFRELHFFRRSIQGREEFGNKPGLD
jgi:hypothetical protein